MRFNLMRLYFDLVYNPVYDLTIARLPFYDRLQAACLDKIQFQNGDKVLCVGVGTGQEISKILQRNHDINIFGIDSSATALKRAHRKTKSDSARIQLIKMDAHKLDFSEGTFHKAISIHVMGFLADDHKATLEILRVLKSGGYFALTYPSGGGSLDLANETLKDVRKNFAHGKRGYALRELFALVFGGLVYLPAFLGVKPQHGFYSRQSLSEVFNSLPIAQYGIDEDRDYQDYIVYGQRR
jgi:ubiquinone/menaquinone biosynthesis C-methylase UbiE